MSHLLVGLDTRLQVAHVDARHGVDRRHVGDDSDNAILSQMFQTDIQMCRQIEMAYVEESALGFAGVLTGFAVVGDIAQLTDFQLSTVLHIEDVYQTDAQLSVDRTFLGILNPSRLQVAYLGNHTPIAAFAEEQAAQLSLLLVILDLDAFEPNPVDIDIELVLGFHAVADREAVADRLLFLEGINNELEVSH